jgi:lipid-binding SYLF domain-containing protein
MNAISRLFALMLLGGTLLLPAGASAQDKTAQDDAAKLTAEARAALQKLYTETPSAKVLGDKAAGILVFPAVAKAGLVIGGQHGKGVLFKGKTTAGFFSTTGVSLGLQAGAQTYGYAMFFMNQKALDELLAAKGFEVGVGPTVVVVDAGAAKDLTTATAKEDIYAFVFGQKGLMAGINLQGTKISKVTP